MDIKKNPKVDLNKFRMGFLFLGLALTGSLCLALLEVGVIDKPMAREEVASDNQIRLIPITPEPEVIIEEEIIEEEEEIIEEIEEDIPEPVVTDEVREAEEGEKIVNVQKGPAPPKRPKKKPKPPITDFPAQEAEYPGGIEAMYAYLGSKIQYPKQAKAAGIQGKVFVEFIVNTDGSVSGVKVLRGIGGGCDEEAIRVIKTLPAWTPAEQAGNKVRQRFKLPVIFTLG